MKRMLSRTARFGPVVMLLLAACSTNSRPKDPCKGSLPKAEPDGIITLEGYYRSSFEISSFVPCGCDLEPDHGAGYLLSEAPGSGLHASYSPLVDTTDPFRPGPTVYIRFEGSVSERGSYGHMGAYPRQVTVNRLIEIAPDGRCP